VDRVEIEGGSDGGLAYRKRSTGSGSVGRGIVPATWPSHRAFQALYLLLYRDIRSDSRVFRSKQREKGGVFGPYALV
jgi:hypothetical protein